MHVHSGYTFNQYACSLRSMYDFGRLYSSRLLEYLKMCLCTRPMQCMWETWFVRRRGTTKWTLRIIQWSTRSKVWSLEDATASPSDCSTWAKRPATHSTPVRTSLHYFITVIYENIIYEHSLTYINLFYSHSSSACTRGPKDHRRTRPCVPFLEESRREGPDLQWEQG